MLGLGPSRPYLILGTDTFQYIFDAPLGLTGMHLDPKLWTASVALRAYCVLLMMDCSKSLTDI